MLYGLFIFWYVGYLVLDDPKDVSAFAEGNNVHLLNITMNMTILDPEDRKNQTPQIGTKEDDLYKKQRKSVFEVENR